MTKARKRDMEKWFYDYKTLVFRDNKENVITQEEWLRYRGKYNKPSDEVLDAILNLTREWRK